MSSSLEELTNILDRVLASLDPWTDPPRPGLSSIDPNPAESSPTVVLALPRSEALAGTQRVIRVTVKAACTRCGGSGTVGGRGRTCRRCNGAGTVAVERQLRVRLPPGLSDGTKLRIDGEGGVPTAGEAPADLFILIQVEP